MFTEVRRNRGKPIFMLTSGGYQVQTNRHTHTLSLTHTHTHSLSLSHTHTHTLSLSLSLSLTHTHTHTSRTLMYCMHVSFTTQMTEHNYETSISLPQQNNARVIADSILTLQRENLISSPQEDPHVSAELSEQGAPLPPAQQDSGATPAEGDT